MRRLILVASVVAAGLSAVHSAGAAHSALATTGHSASVLCVGGPHCYSTVQAAVDAASDGDTIRIGPGTFPGGVTITKSLTLTGVGGHAD